MSKLKTSPNESDVQQYLNSVEDEQKRKDCFTLLKMMKSLTGNPPKMWGNSIVGFGSYHYKYDSGRAGDWFLCGFAPRKQNLTMYIMSGFKKQETLLKKLGKYKTGKSCLYVKKLEDIDQAVLKQMIITSINYLAEKYPSD